MMIEVTTSELVQNAADLLEQVKSGQTHVKISENGKPVAYLIDIATYRKIEHASKG